jgi:hypothetical protein
MKTRKMKKKRRTKTEQQLRMIGLRMKRNWNQKK